MFRRMKFYLAVLTISSDLIMLNFLSLCEGKSMIWIQHPGTNDFFLRLFFNNGTLSSVKNLRLSAKIALCNSTITLFSTFKKSNLKASNSEESSRAGSLMILRRALYPYLFDVDQNSYDYTTHLSDPNTSYLPTRVKVGDYTIAVDALPCIELKNHRWYIFSRHNNDVYFTAECTPDDSFTLTGILEPWPQIYSYNRDAILLEKEFLRGQRWSARLKKRTSLCNMDALHKFRLCNTVYATWIVWQRQMLTPYRWFVTKGYERVTCLREVNIHLTNPPPSDEPVSLAVDLLPCAVLKNKPNTAFFIAMDEINPYSVFLVQKRRSSTDNSVEYVLSLHVKNVASLTVDIRSDLLVDIDEEDIISDSETSS